MNNGFRARLEASIPGGAHTYSRGSDQFPSNAPEIVVRGKGSYTWDPNGRKFLDYGMGLRSVILGYADRGVTKAAVRGLRAGQNLTRPALIELEAAELFLDTIDSAEMVKFTKNGSSAVTAAVKLARGFTGKSKILVCKQHPFFSYDDWFISSTPISLGIPEGISDLVIPFEYGDTAQLKSLLEEFGDEVAAVLLEPATDIGPSSGQDTFRPTAQNFLTDVQELSKEYGALFILDEMITGFRLSSRGAQSIYGVSPDLTTFGKAMGNGLPIAAVAGKRAIMELGSISRAGSERLFLMSTTHGPELASLSAMIHVVSRLRKSTDLQHISEYGTEMILRLNEVSASHGLEGNLIFYGNPASPYFKVLDNQGAPSLALRTVLAQELINNGVMMPWIALSSSHDQKEMRVTVRALDEAAKILARAVNSDASLYLVGDPIKPVFRRYN